jgi:hypothetical protein
MGLETIMASKSAHLAPNSPANIQKNTIWEAWVFILTYISKHLNVPSWNMPIKLEHTNKRYVFQVNKRIEQHVSQISGSTMSPGFICTKRTWLITSHTDWILRHKYRNKQRNHSQYNIIILYTILLNLKSQFTCLHAKVASQPQQQNWFDFTLKLHIVENFFIYHIWCSVDVITLFINQ